MERRNEMRVKIIRYDLEMDDFKKLNDYETMELLQSKTNEEFMLEKNNLIDFKVDYFSQSPNRFILSMLFLR